MAWRLVVRRHGGPEVIEREEFDPGEPGPGQILIENEVIGLNLIDTYYRKGLYEAPLPIALGSESAGKVVAVGPDVAGFAIGERIGSVNGPGAYATHRLVAADRAVMIPDEIGSEAAAATMLKGFTACYLAEEIAALRPGQTALVHSAAGGVGSILVPWLRHRGVRVIAHAGTDEKAATVNADLSLSCPFDELAEQVLGLTGGSGVDVIFDGVGRASWTASLASLKRRGLMVSYGNASGAVPPVSLLELMHAGSVFVTRPTLADYTVTTDQLRNTADRLFALMHQGVIKPLINQRFALIDAVQAHRAIESRQTMGSTILLP